MGSCSKLEDAAGLEELWDIGSSLFPLSDAARMTNGCRAVIVRGWGVRVGGWVGWGGGVVQFRLQPSPTPNSSICVCLELKHKRSFRWH